MNSMLPSLRSTMVDHQDSFDNFFYDPNYTFQKFKTDVSKDVFLHAKKTMAKKDFEERQ